MYAHVTRLLKSVSDPFPLHIRTSSDYRKKPYPHPHPCIIRSAPNPTKKSGLGYGKGITRTDPIRFHPYQGVGRGGVCVRALGVGRDGVCVRALGGRARRILGSRLRMQMDWGLRPDDLVGACFAFCDFLLL